MEDNTNIGINLGEIGNRSPLKVPDGYFDTLPERVQARCVPTELNQMPFGLMAILRKQSVIAYGLATFFAVVLVSYLLLIPQSPLTENLDDQYVRIVQQQIWDIDYELPGELSPSFESQRELDDYQELIIKYLVNDQIDYLTLIDEY